ncbi:MAG: Fis family transcriptional regulator [Desulfobacterales bacterium C00003104]|jgi:two-component system nitrogen regulation response regulator NtrX|nr:MAG: Fis family transcriptional regulator [Desulfobacterales bacterium C00003104]
MLPSVLVVDDEPSILRSLHGVLADEGYDVLTAPNGYEALKIIEEESPDLVLLDIWMPGMDGIETLKEIKKNNPFLQVVIISGHGTIETAVRATKLGAYDFIEKPLSIEKVMVAINNALKYQRIEEENRLLKRRTLGKSRFTGGSPPVKALQQQVAVVAPTDAWVLIAGENGAGKELVARTIHQMSNRAEYRLVEVNCAAIPDELIESELFGYEKGAFAGAKKKKRGKFELADGGTIFFDEIGDMSLKTQAKTLRILDEQKFERLGGTRTLEVDVRVIAASNKNLEDEIAKGDFREDLYFRLNVVPVKVPPLRDRIADIPILIQEFLKTFAQNENLQAKEIGPEAVKLLQEYEWPGNVRELKNLIERLMITIPDKTIDVKDIPEPYARRKTPGKYASFFRCASLEEARKEFEKAYLAQRLAEHHGKI